MIPGRFGRSIGALAALAVLMGTISGCSNTSPTAPSNYAAYSQTDLVVGTGTIAANGNTVTVNYTGWLYDDSKTDKKGPQFETSLGGSTFSFVLGAGQVITGWDKGVVGMAIGGKRRLILPPSEAYGASRNSIIPPNATLIFEIDLVSIQ